MKKAYMVREYSKNGWDYSANNDRIYPTLQQAKDDFNETSPRDAWLREKASGNPNIEYEEKTVKLIEVFLNDDRVMSPSYIDEYGYGYALDSKTYDINSYEED